MGKNMKIKCGCASKACTVQMAVDVPDVGDSVTFEIFDRASDPLDIVILKKDIEKLITFLEDLK